MIGLKRMIALLLCFLLVSGCAAPATSGPPVTSDSPSSESEEALVSSSNSSSSSEMEALEPGESSVIPVDYDPSEAVVPLASLRDFTLYTQPLDHYDMLEEMIYLPVPYPLKEPVSCEDFFELPLYGGCAVKEYGTLYFCDGSAVLRLPDYLWKIAKDGRDQVRYTVAKTLFENIPSLEKLRIEYQREEDGAITTVLEWSAGDKALQTKPPEVTMDELTRMRQTALWTPEPRTKADYLASNPLPSALFPDETACMLNGFLYEIGGNGWRYTGFPSFSSPHEIDPLALLDCALKIAPNHSWGSFQGENYLEGFDALSTYSASQTGVLKEDVETAAALIFGDGVKVDHYAFREEGRTWHYQDYAGVHIGYPAGGGASFVPLVLWYQKLPGGVYQAEVVDMALQWGSEPQIDPWFVVPHPATPEDAWEALELVEAVELYWEQGDRRLITIKTRPDGSLYLGAVQPKPTPTSGSSNP